MAIVNQLSQEFLFILNEYLEVKLIKKKRLRYFIENFIMKKS